MKIIYYKKIVKYFTYRTTDDTEINEETEMINNENVDRENFREN